MRFSGDVGGLLLVTTKARTVRVEQLAPLEVRALFDAVWSTGDVDRTLGGSVVKVDASVVLKNSNSSEGFGPGGGLAGHR